MKPTGPSEQDYLDAREYCRNQLSGDQVDASSALMSPRELCRYHTARWRTLNDVLSLWRTVELGDNPPASAKVFNAALLSLEATANEAQHHAGLAWRKESQDAQDAEADKASRIVPAKDCP